MKKIIIIAGMLVLLLLVVAACGTTEQPDTQEPVEEPGVEQPEGPGAEQPVEEDPIVIEYEYTEDGVIKPEIAEQVISEISTDVLIALKEKAVDTISDFVHPTKGVRFTPYTHVSIENDVVLSKEKMNEFFEVQEQYLWGFYDGRGNEILLTPAEYYEKFIYTEDFIVAEDVGYNEILSFGNMLENQFEAYENPIVVEYYFSGFNPQYEGMDWKSLRLIFEEYEGTWFLVGIIHNQWTI